MRTLIGLLCALALSRAQAPERCVAEGQVVSSVTGEALSKARVEVRGSGQTGVALTTSDGRFSIAVPASGRYDLTVERSGYQRNRLRDVAVTVPMEKLMVRLDPYSVLAGRVLDEDGEPLSEAWFTAWRCGYRLGRRIFMYRTQGSTNDLGQFRIYDLRPGRYVVSAGYARGAGGEGYVETYYPGTTTPESATVVDLQRGARVEGLEVALKRARVVKVRGQILPEGERPDKYIGLRLGTASVALRRDRTEFEFAEVPPGNYTLRADTDLQPFYGGALPLAVGNGDIEGVRLPVGPGVKLAGQLRTDGNRPVDFRKVYVHLDQQTSQYPIKVNEDGSLVPAAFRPDEYVLVVWGEGVYMKSARLGQVEVIEGGLNLFQQPPPLDIVLGTDAGEVEGSVEDGEALVVLVPEDRTRFLLYRKADTDAKGNFRIRGIAPGSYRLFAFAEMQDEYYYDPEFLKRYESSATEVTVAPNGRERKTLKLIH